MKTKLIYLTLASALSAILAVSAVAHEKNSEAFSPAELTERMLHRRAVEAVIWGMPAVNADLMFQAMHDAKADFNQVVYWSRPVTWKNQTLTPNPDTIYLMPFFNTKDAGPMVLEIPPAGEGESITGSIDEAWQTAIEDVGPAGVDKGKGGKYLILPPGYKERVPEGYFAMPSGTYTGYALLRSNLKSASEDGIAKAVAYGKRIKFYPLSQAADPPPTRFVDAIDIVFDSTIPYDLRFFQTLDRVVQRESWYERDRVMIDQLKTIGIEKGTPFNPDAGTQKILSDAAHEAHDWLDLKYQGHFATPYNEGSHWALPAESDVLEGLQTNFAKPDAYPVEGRGVGYSMGYFSAKHLGAGQFYLMTILDKDGQPFDGASTYRLTVPPNAPVRLYWSATAYDRQTHALIRGMSRASLASNDTKVQKNSDGSTDIYFGPAAPAGKESNWVPTDPKRQFELLFRLYGPKKELFEKTWKLPDVQEVK